MKQILMAGLILIGLAGGAMADEVRVDISEVCPGVTNDLVIYETSNIWTVTDHPVRMPLDWDKAYPQYAKGANDALDAIMLLHLEQQLQGANRTWGAMAEIVCERINIERRK